MAFRGLAAPIPSSAGTPGRDAVSRSPQGMHHKRGRSDRSQMIDPTVIQNRIGEAVAGLEIIHRLRPDDASAAYNALLAETLKSSLDSLV